MKHLIFLLTLVLYLSPMQAFSQAQHPYKQDWDKISRAEKSGKTRTAWNIAKKIYIKASADKNEQEKLKALIYQLKYRKAIAENADLKNIHQVDSLTEQATGIFKSLLKNLKANLYLSYLHDNKYKILNRTSSSAEKQENISTWSLPHLYDTISVLYIQSIKNKKLLKSIQTQSYTTLIDTGKNTLSLRPTLYDILVHNALTYFSSKEYTLTKPAQHFVINDPKSFARAKDFIKQSFHTADTSSLAWRALKLYQDLIAFHIDDKNRDALIDADLHRIDFVYKKAVLSQKDKLYQKALRRLIEKYPAPKQSEAIYRLASWFYHKGNLYDAQKHPKNHWDKKAALILSKRGSDTLLNEGNVKCNRLKERILRPKLSIKTEQVNIPNMPFRALVSYQNEKQVWFRIVQLETKPKRIFRHPVQMKDLLEADPVKAWNQDLPLPKDYQEHRVEIKIDKLPTGRYALIASTNPDFNKKESPTSFTKFSISDLSYVEDKQGNFLVLDRENGKPVKKAKVRIWHTEYSRKKKRKVLDKGNRYKTDKNGYFHLDEVENRGRFLLEISRKKRFLFITNNTYHPRVIPEITKKTKLRGFLFTDRAIYRPGQKLYFKGLLTEINPNTHEHTVVKDKTITVFLYNANNQKSDSLTVTSNDFGSFSGNFNLPKASINGRMHLSVTHPGIYQAFKMEEYKRPTFDVQWEKKAKSYNLDDKVTVSGKVKAYNGAPENGANIKYQVSRKQFRFPFRQRNRSFTIIPPYNREEHIITQGTLQADSAGDFHIPFKALPNEKVPAKYRIFNYEISIDVTNLSGESHHYTYYLPIGNHSLLLSLNMPERMKIKNTDTLFVKSTDLQGNFKSTPVAISIYPLSPPHRFIRKRLWKAPDQFIMDKKDFLDYFPHDEYKEEANMENWTKGSPVFVSNDQTKANEKILFNPGNIRQGWYMIHVMAKDKNGTFVTDSQYVQVYHAGLRHIPFFHKMIWTTNDTLSGAPGEKISWQLGSSEKAFIFQETNTLKKKKGIEKLRLNHKVKVQNYTLSEEDRGGLIRHYVAVRFNRVFHKDLYIRVPWKEKQLHIQYKTFRNKILPGKKENWVVQITGPKHKNVNAELMASMYDLSLDQFTPHSWDALKNIFPLIKHDNAWTYDQNFRLSQPKNVFVYNPKNKKYPDFRRKYPTLKSFGLFQHFYRFQPRLQGEIVGFAAQSTRQKRVNSKTDNANDAGLMEEVVQSESKTNKEDTPSSLPKKQRPVKIRKDFRETAFFYPQLKTDTKGNVSFSFTSPEALTQWKLMLQAHTKDMKVGYSEKTVLTQKPLMIQMNAPRFVRQGDTLVLSAKVSNLSKALQSGKATLSLKNTVTDKNLSFILEKTKIPFSVKPGQISSVSWKIAIPKEYTDALTYIVQATSKNFSDGEQDILPVLSNKTEITSSLPFHFTGNGNHKISWENFSQLKDNATVQPQNITVEYTGNPIWYVVQALPFIDKNFKKNTNTLFRKIYANTLGRYVALKIPHFKEVTQHWLQDDSSALKSALQKNRELKNILLQETPWVRTAQSEAAQKAKIAHWYQQKDEQLRLNAAIKNLKKLQLKNGGFSWFKNMPDSRLITQEIITGMGHLKKLDAWPHIATDDLRSIVRSAMPYLDAKMVERYHWLQTHHQLEKMDIEPIDIQYLYMRSFFSNIPKKSSVDSGYHYFYQQAKKHWNNQTPYLKAMLALTFQGEKDYALARKLLTSLKESLIKDTYGGLHWKKHSQGYYYWYQAPLSTQAIGIEAFSDLSANKDTLNAMKKWLLNQKQTRFWGTGKATANAIYALLLNGEDWSASKPEVHLRIGDSSFVIGKEKWGLQYKKITIPKEDITAKMKNIRINISGASAEQPGWGAAYFQYFSNMNKVTRESSELHIERQISKERNTPDGKKLSPISTNTQLKVGDKIQVRLIVKADRDMDFVHFKDLRASCMEPLQVLSGYRFKDGTGYYSTVDDAAVHFYFRHLPKGTYVFTYPVYITQKGDFTGGLSQIESMYAPEVRGHSEGVRIHVR